MKRSWTMGVRLASSVALVLAVVCGACAQPAPAGQTPPMPPGCQVLSYDDGKSDGSRSIAGATQTMVFDKPAGDWSLVQVWLHGSRYGYPAPPSENFDIYVCDAQMNVLKEYQRAYSTFGRGDAKWVVMPLEPVLLTDKFYVLFHFHAEQTKGVFVHYDTSVAESHSWVGAWGGETKPMREKSDWMIRAVIAPGKPEAQPVAQIPPQQAPVVPPTYAQPGAPQAADDTVLKQYALPYGTFQRGPERWYDMPVEPVWVPDLFYVCFAFSPTRTKGVFVSYDKSVKQTHSKMGVPGKHIRHVGENLEWMIRATLAKAAP